jgi:hypothetical protein
MMLLRHIPEGIIVTHDVNNEKGKGWIGRSRNALHIRDHSECIRQMILWMIHE